MEFVVWTEAIDKKKNRWQDNDHDAQAKPSLRNQRGFHGKENKLFDSTYAMSKGSREQINSTDFPRLCDDETVRLNTDWNREVNETFVSVVDCARHSSENDSILSQKCENLGRNVSR